MANEFDYDEEVMKESIPSIFVPFLTPPVASSRVEIQNQDALLLDLQKLIEEQRIKQEKRIQCMKKKQQNIGEQVNKRLAQKDRKIRELEEEQKRKTYAQCTFKPKTSKKGNSRSFQQFLKQQQDFTKRLEQKRTTLKESLDAQKQGKNTFKPKTNIRTEERKKQGTVFQRLYALKDKENEDDGNSRITEDFHPKITEKGRRMTRNAPINQLLYQDAIRRQERAKGYESQNLQSIPLPGKMLNLNNEKYVAQKFIKEYYGVIERNNVPSSTKEKIDYMLFNQILKEMGFVQVDEESQNSHQRTLIHEAYQLLEGFQVNAKNICVFLLALIGVFHINPVNFQEGEEPSPDEQLAFDQAQGRKIQKTFDLFKRNRLFSENQRKTSTQEETLYSFKPQTNKASDRMAELHRQQMLQDVNQLLEMYPEIDFNIPKDGVISPTDLLVLYNKAKEFKLQCRKQEIEEQKLEECTFKPTTLPESQAMISSKFSTGEGSLGQKKSLELYHFHRQLQNKKESLRVSRQSEDLMMKECTFAPNIARQKVQTDQSNYSTKMVQQALFRMRKGREQWQEKKRFLERGEPSSMRKDQKYNSATEKDEEKNEETPILLLDVNLGSKVERLTLFSGDEDCLEEVASQFSRKHGLDAQSQSKLIELLQEEVENMLSKIPEDEESEDNNQ